MKRMKEKKINTANYHVDRIKKNRKTKPITYKIT